MRSIFRLLARILRRVMRKLRAGAAHIDGFFGGLFGGGAVYDKIEEAGLGGVEEVVAPDLDADQRAEDLARQLPIDTFSPAVAVKKAVELRSAGKAFSGTFDLRAPEQRRLCAYVTALDEHGLRSIRCMPVGTLERHLDGSPWVAVGLRQVDAEIILARDLAAAKVAAAAQKPEKTKKRTRQEDASASVLTAAKAAGREATLEEIVAARRRAA